MPAIQAVTFDLWDTIIQDDSDEQTRRERGLRTKFVERRQIVWELLGSVKPIPYEVAEQAYSLVDAAFNKVWHEQFVTWSVAERLDLIAKGLGVAIASDSMSAAIQKLEVMEVEVPPNPIEGIEEVLSELATKYPLAVISDAIVTPGRELRSWLKKFNMYHYFSGFAFSDEVGHSKPHPEIFESAASQLSVDLSGVVHIGDREHNDIKGAHAMNMRAILFTGSRKTDLKNNTADAVCSCYSELPEILHRLAS